MKTIVKFTVVLVVALTHTLGNAKGIESNIIANAVDKTLVFEMFSPVGGSKIEFLDSDKNSIYSEKIVNVGSYRKKFDLRHLAKGLYLLRVVSETSTVLYDMVIDAHKIGISKKRARGKIVFRKSDDMVYLNLLNFYGKNVGIKVYDSQDRVVHSETCNDTFVVERAFNFKKALKDDYRIVVSDEEQIFYERITID